MVTSCADQIVHIAFRLRVREQESAPALAKPQAAKKRLEYFSLAKSIFTWNN
jgi:hypothetical protein